VFYVDYIFKFRGNPISLREIQFKHTKKINLVTKGLNNYVEIN